MKRRRFLFLVAVLLVAGAVAAAIDRHGWPHIRALLFRAFPTTGEVVMVGDSLTEYADWNALLGRTDVVNRGIVGDTTGSLLRRLDTVDSTGARVAFLMIGINDLLRGEAPALVTARIAGIVDGLAEDGKRLILQSVLRTGDSDALNQSVDLVNAELQQLCAKDRCTFVDLNALLAPDGRLMPANTVDGVHLSTAGYRLWATEIAPLMPPAD